ncbi:MAG: hypothetical protein H0T46_10610 [Deltaproteobacteria bacterium]|nr:hypothetical protein [Deltaproteobacteria bacterium]
MSNIIRLFSALVLTTAACASDDNIVELDPNVPESAADTEAPTQIQFVPDQEPVDVAACQANGPCSAACDDALILELFVPEGTCVVFDCTLDGGTTRVGGCN